MGTSGSFAARVRPFDQDDASNSVVRLFLQCLSHDSQGGVLLPRLRIVTSSQHVTLLLIAPILPDHHPARAFRNPPGAYRTWRTKNIEADIIHLHDILAFACNIRVFRAHARPTPHSPSSCRHPCNLSDDSPKTTPQRLPQRSKHNTSTIKHHDLPHHKQSISHYPQCN